MKNIIAISGSLRKDSYNTKVLEEIKKMIDKSKLWNTRYFKSTFI